MKLEERLKCVGYYGFGGGYNEATLRKAGRRPAGDVKLYCDVCDIRQSCWDAHRARVQKMFPELTKALDEHTEECRAKGITAGQMLEQWKKKMEPYGNPDTVQEPYSSVMLGNIEDGIYTVELGAPKNRHEMTISWDKKNRRIQT